MRGDPKSGRGRDSEVAVSGGSTVVLFSCAFTCIVASWVRSVPELSLSSRAVY